MISRYSSAEILDVASVRPTVMINIQNISVYVLECSLKCGRVRPRN